MHPNDPRWQQPTGPITGQPHPPSEPQHSGGYQPYRAPGLPYLGAGPPRYQAGPPPTRKSNKALWIVGGIGAALLAVVVVAVVVITTGGGQPASNSSPPVVVLDGKDLNFGSGVTSASSTCQDNPKPGIQKSVMWRGLTTNGPEPEQVSLGFLSHNNINIVLLELRLPNGQTYNSNLKTTHITADGPTNRVYKFSGTVHRDSGSDPDFLTTLNVSGSIACANYGSQSGCKFASVAEMSTAANLPLTGTEDRQLDGCLYFGGGGSQAGVGPYVKLELFPTTAWDDRLNRQANGADSRIEDVPDLGEEAKWVSPVVFVKVDPQHSFLVLVSPSQSENDEIAVAKVLVPRIQAR